MGIRRFSSLLIAVTVLALVPAAWAGPVRFEGDLDPANWTMSLTNSNGSVDVSGAPEFIRLIGTDGYESGLSGRTDYRITVPQDLSITFWWHYVSHDRDGATYDPAGYYLNGALVQLSEDAGWPSQRGQVRLDLAAGDRFGFWVSSTDNMYGRGELDISGVPEPATLGIVGTGLFAIVLFRRKRA